MLVVGAGASGAQIAEELLRAGRRVFISIGPHDRPPRRYRGRDNVWWLGVLNKWDAEAPPGTKHVTFAVSGAYGGATVDYRRLAARGMTLLGRAASFADGVMTFEPGLAENLATGDRNYLSVLDEADAWVARNGLDLPEEPEARVIPPDPDCVTDPILSLDLAAAGITSIVWATGYTLDFGWLKVDAFDEAGRPRHQRGVSSEPGVYFLGLPWLSRRGSSFIWGVWHDAKFVADHIATQRAYLAYAPDRRGGGRGRATGGARRLTRRHDRSDESPMAHTRIRKFNTRDTYPEQNLDNDLAQAVVARGATIFLRGQCPQDLDTAANIDSHDPVEQTHKVMQNIRQLIEESGGRMEHLVQGRRLPDRRPPPRGGLPHDGRVHPRRAPGLDRPRRLGAGPPRMAGRDRRHRRDPGLSPVAALSPRLRAAVDALPLFPGARVLEIGCGPGAAAREIARRVDPGRVLGIDRSPTAIAQATAAGRAEVAAGLLEFRCTAAEDLVLAPGEAPYDLALALRVGALDGRHPEAGRAALPRIAAALKPGGRLFIDGGDPLREVTLAVGE